MATNKKRLYVALYPSGVVGNEERRLQITFLRVRHHLTYSDFIGLSWSDQKQRKASMLPVFDTT